MDKTKYTIDEHRHRVYAWAASRAIKGLKVVDGSAVLKFAGLDKLLSKPEKLPSPKSFDKKHREWRDAIKESIGGDFSSGKAAKLINVYLKLVFVCGGFHEHPRVANLHPPIDSVLLKELIKLSPSVELKKSFGNAQKAKWTKFNDQDYENVILAVQRFSGEKPLWMIEDHWSGLI